MRAIARRIGRDLIDRRNLDAYAIALVALLAALVSLVSDVVSAQLKWGITLASLGLLVYRLTVPDPADCTVDDLLDDRTAFDAVPLPARLRDAQEVWIFAPSAVNLLSESTCQLLRGTVLRRPDGVVRVVVLDPAETAAVEIASRQLDDALEFPIQRLPECLDTTVARLSTIEGWAVNGSFEHRKIGYNPGFSLVVIDPSTRGGSVIVEFHGIRNESPAGRMHMELTRKNSERWYAYWIAQFHHIWGISV
jgi:hypothetical protein